MNTPVTIPLLDSYPGIKSSIPYVKLGEFPTPIKKMELLGRELGISKLYIKRDDLSGKTYGGNKIRKLEFLLGEALSKNATSIFTFGAAGSNHALATAIYGKELGLDCTLFLLPQPNARYVRNNLLMSLQTEAEINYVPSATAATAISTYRSLMMRFREKNSPMIIPFGGTTPQSTLSFVNAAFELRDQIDKGRMPEPDYIYIPMGSMGTAAGLMVGLKACGLKTKVVPIRIVPLEIANERKVRNLMQRTVNFLNKHDAAFPRYEIFEDEIEIRHEFSGSRYALYTDEGVRAVKIMKKNEDISLEGTYTGKALAALVADAKRGLLKDKVVLFWNTYNSRDFSTSINQMDYRDLPQPFHKYFEGPLQPLDKRQ